MEKEQTKQEEKMMTLEEMQQECCRVAMEICKLRSIMNRHQKYFNDLSYKIYELMKKQENESNVSTNSENS